MRTYVATPRVHPHDELHCVEAVNLEAQSSLIQDNDPRQTDSEK